MKKGYSALCLALAAAMAASVGVSAASAVTKDDFSDYKKAFQSFPWKAFSFPIFTAFAANNILLKIRIFQFFLPHT